MYQFVRTFFAAVSTALLVSCGGGTAPASQYGDGLQAPAPQRAGPLRVARIVDATALMDWAERAYPGYFPSHEADRPWGAYLYRAYANGLYLGVADGFVYVMGGEFGNVPREVAPVAQFACSVYPENCPVVSGVAAKGLLQGATVSVYNLNGDGSKGGLLASATTAADGQFSVRLPSQPAGPVLVEADGGSYTSAYNGATVASSRKMAAMLAAVSATGEAGVSVNPLSDMAVSLARLYLAQNYSVSGSIDTAENWVAWQYGLRSRPSRIIPRFDVAATTADPEGVQLALVIAALDTLGHRLFPNDPDVVFAALSLDFYDGTFDGRMGSQQITVAGQAMNPAAGSTEFMRAFGVTFSGTASGLRPGYLDTHFGRATIVENYQARIIPVYVASQVQQLYPARYTSPLPRTTRLDTSVTGCPAGAPVSEQNGVLSCGSFYSCGSATLVIVNGRESCSDGSIAVFHSATIAFRSLAAPASAAMTRSMTR